MDKKILITGSNGFICKELKSYLLNKNYKVNTTNRIDKSYFFFDLEDQSNFEINLPKFDILIHLAYFRDPSYQVEKKYNLNGAKKIFSIAKKYNAKIIYFSSQSADKNSFSNYGKTKYEIEKIAEEFNAHTIRPGLIYNLKSIHN